MERVVSFYAGLPRGPAPQTKAAGLLGRYQARYFNKNSPARKLKLSMSWDTLGTDLEQRCSTPLLVFCSWVTAWSTTSTCVSTAFINRRLPACG